MGTRRIQYPMLRHHRGTFVIIARGAGELVILLLINRSDFKRLYYIGFDDASVCVCVCVCVVMR